MIAKTGTAEFGTGADLQTHAWMIAAQGDLAVCVFVDVGESGSQTAGPILEAFLRAARWLLTSFAAHATEAPRAIGAAHGAAATTRHRSGSAPQGERTPRRMGSTRGPCRFRSAPSEVDERK